MIKNILFLILFCLSLIVSAQPPQLIPYQAIARDNSGNPVLNQNIGLRFSIHDQTISGTVLWQESQTVVSNNLGIIVTALGGTAQLTTVDWGSGAKFLQVEMDIAGGTNYLDMGTQQMMSVPYALYAETSGSVINSGGNGSFTHWIGELYGGGVIFYLWLDALGFERGLIVDITDLSNSYAWSNNSQSIVGLSSQSIWDGLSNSLAIVGQAGHTNSAALICLNSNNGGQSDWYLPSLQEWNMLWSNYYAVARSLSQIPGATQLVESVTNSSKYYWSSSENSAGSFSGEGYAWYFDFIYGNANVNYKFSTYYVRAIRAF